MGASKSKSMSKADIKVPSSMNDMAPEERAQALKDLTSKILDQRIEFAFRKTDITPRGKEVIKAVAIALTAVPEIALCLEGHSNFVAKAAPKLTPADEERILKLSEARAEACKKALEAEGVQNQITCVACGAMQKEKTGCVKLVPKLITANATTSTADHHDAIEQQVNNNGSSLAGTELQDVGLTTTGPTGEAEPAETSGSAQVLPGGSAESPESTAPVSSGQPDYPNENSQSKGDAHTPGAKMQQTALEPDEVITMDIVPALATATALESLCSPTEGNHETIGDTEESEPVCDEAKLTEVRHTSGVVHSQWNGILCCGKPKVADPPCHWKC